MHNDNAKKIKGGRSFDSDSLKKERKRRAVEDYLVPSITLMVYRVHSITADQLPKFRYFYDLSDPIEAF